MRKHFLLFSLAYLLFSGSSFEEIINNELVRGEWEKEFEISLTGAVKNVGNKLVEASGTTASYAISGLAYATDFIAKVPR